MIGEAVSKIFRAGGLAAVGLLAALWIRGEEPRLGRIDFPTSATGPAQKAFLRGVLLLHSFEYDDARDEFRTAEKLSPRFAMAYWGDAMTFNHPIWHEQDREGALEALKRLGPTAQERLARAPTDREKSYLHAVEVLYGDGDKKARDLAYAEEMRGVAERFGGDDEASAFYALAMLGTCTERDFAAYMKAAGVLETIFQRNPDHPGAAHYLIHSYDDPIHAPLGLRPARVYANIAAAAGHAQHMPSHIFLALGMWDETAASNEAAWRVSQERVQRKGLGVDELNYHALFWLEYAYLQQGRFRDARNLVLEMERDAKKTASGRAKNQLARMRAAEMVETGTAERGAAPVEASAETVAAEAFARGFVAIRSGDPEKARAALAAMRPSGDGSGSAHAHGGAGAYAAAEGARGVLEQELHALVAISEGKLEEGVSLLQAATAAEDRMSFEFGPPDIVKPSHELLGEVLLEAGRAQEAEAEFQKALARAPGRALSIRGLRVAATRTGNRSVADAAALQYEKIRRRADRKEGAPDAGSSPR